MGVPNVGGGMNTDNCEREYTLTTGSGAYLSPCGESWWWCRWVQARRCGSATWLCPRYLPSDCDGPGDDEALSKRLHDLEHYQLRTRAVLAALARRIDSWGSSEAAEVVRAAALEIEAEEEP